MATPSFFTDCKLVAEGFQLLSRGMQCGVHVDLWSQIADEIRHRKGKVTVIG